MNDDTVTHRNPAAGHAGASGPHSGSRGAVLSVMSRVIRLLLGLGIRLGPMALLTVPGRKTGTPRTSPVDLFERDGRYWLVATHDANASWVHNVRAAGEGALAIGRRRYAFSAAELSQAEAAIVFTEVLAPRIAKPLAGLVLRRTLGVGPGAPPDAFTAAAALHPVFELTLSPASSPRPAPSGARRPA
jgi:deazaflavin-dependent oxidoreductase (nitroreductase family)